MKLVKFTRFTPAMKKAAAAASLLALAGAAKAEGAIALDLAPINAAIATITQVGTLVFAVVVGIKTFQWVRRAL